MKTITISLLVVATFVGFVMLLSLPFMWLWNWLMPNLFGIKQISWLQALGLLVLSSMIFGHSSRGKKN